MGGPRKLIFGTPPYFDPTKRDMLKIQGAPCRVKLYRVDFLSLLIWVGAIVVIIIVVTGGKVNSVGVSQKYKSILHSPTGFFSEFFFMAPSQKIYTFFSSPPKIRPKRGIIAHPQIQGVRGPQSGPFPGVTLHKSSNIL